MTNHQYEKQFLKIKNEKVRINLKIHFHVSKRNFLINYLLKISQPILIPACWYIAGFHYQAAIELL